RPVTRVVPVNSARRPPKRETDRRMQRLTGLDAAFLSLESPVAHMHVMGVAILDPSGVEGFDFDRVRAHLLERLPLIPPFRQRLVHVPFGLHYPVWVED